MTGGSLGLRTGSYGSLQPLQNSAALLIQATPPIVRKPPKLLLSSSREKDKLLQFLCKMVFRRRFMMPLLVLISIAVFIMLMSAISKDAREGSHEHSAATQHYRVFRPLNDFTLPRDLTPPLFSDVLNKEQANGSSTLLDAGLVPHDSKIPGHFGFHPTPLPRGHPCEKFALPPPPADKKRTGPRPCPVCYLPVDQAMALMPSVPSISPVVKNLTFVLEEPWIGPLPSGGSQFGGYPSLKQRNDSFTIKESMNVYCGFVRGNRPGHNTGFDIDVANLLEMEQCHGIVVASAIFGNYDLIQQPKNISEAAKRNVCFYMFLDEETESVLKNYSMIDDTNRVGLWRVVVVHNLPYTDARRNGKVPKLLLHRIFPNARFSLWIDGKLELVVDPYQILERFLWRTKATFAISRHYKRFDVFMEAEANKAAGKYDNASIDNQIEFYKNEGLTPYSSAKFPISSDVPEGCVIIREHIPITNLFSCLWFNEVDRFTSRDQISFSTVRDKIMSQVNWSVNMFLDCERRNFVVQAYHRDLLEQMSPGALAIFPPPPLLTGQPSKRALPDVPESDMVLRSLPRKASVKRSREKRSGSRRHRARTNTGREANSF